MLTEPVYTVRFEGALTTVTLEHLNFKAVGHALCSSEDAYDATFGEELAYRRAAERFHKKVIKELVKGVQW